jgi:amidase
MQRRCFIQTSAAALLTGCGRKLLSSRAAPLSLAEAVSHLRAGELSSVALLRHYLERLERLDRAGPELRSVIELHPDAMMLAKRSDEAKPGRPLHGAPILIKDNIETADAMLTTAGSLALLDAPKPARDAEIVRRLREAGAVIFGKTNLSEWANIRSSKSTSGWSARGGLTRNPHKLSHSASGSSSGSAVAVAMGFCAAAIGTETNGSIVSPASACGIVGLKPTLGSVSRSGIIPITQWQDTAGPMTRTVRDAALLMNVLSGLDARDSHSRKPPEGHAGDHTALMQPRALRGVRLGIVRELCGENQEVLALFERALEKLRQAGAILVDQVTLPNHRAAGGLSWKAMLPEFRADLNAYLETRGGPVRSLADVIAFNLAHRDAEMPHFAQELFDEAERMSTPEAIAEAVEARTLSKRLSGPEGIDAALGDHQLQALICPTNDPIQRITLDQGDAHVRCCCGPAAAAGYPHLTVPMGGVDGLPVGLSFFGAAWTEPQLLAYGDAFEKIMPAPATPALA